MRQASADLMVYVATLMPFPYVQLVTFIVKFQVFLTFTDLAYDVRTQANLPLLVISDRCRVMTT